MTGNDASWQRPPESEREIAFTSQAQMHRAAARAERSYFSTWRVSPVMLSRFTQGDGYCLYWKHPAVALGFGLPGLALIIANIPLGVWLAGSALERGGGLGLLRLGMIFAGAILLFIALPLYKPAGWNWDKQREEDKAHEYFRSKRGV